MSLLSPPLRAFMAIVKHKTVHAAAEVLCLTQTAVTQRIKSLEKQLKTCLFVRTRRGMNLTPEGEALVRYCQACDELEGEAMAVIQGAAVESDVEFTFSGPTSLMRSRLMPGLMPVVQKYSHLLVHFDINDVENRHLALRSGQCDFAVLQPIHVSAEMQAKKLQPEHYVLVGPVVWQDRPLTDILQNERIIDFNPSDEMTFQYLKQFKLDYNAGKKRLFANQTGPMASMIAAGLGFGVLTAEFAESYIARGELYNLDPKHSMAVEHILAWYDRPDPPKYFADMIAALH